MAPVPFKCVLSFTSQDPKHNAQNLLKQNTGGPTGKRWLCEKGLKSGEMEAEIQLEEPVTISHVDIGAYGCFSVNVEVGKSTWARNRGYETLIPGANFMTMQECRMWKSLEKVRMFSQKDFDLSTRNGTWDRVKVTCRQPFNKSAQFGLSFIMIKADSVKASEQCVEAEPMSAKSPKYNTLKTLNGINSPPWKSGHQKQMKLLLSGLDSPKAEKEEHVKNRLLKIAGSAETGSENVASLSRTAKLVMSAVGKQTIYAPRGPRSNDEMVSTPKRRRVELTFEQELEIFFEGLDMSTIDMDKVTFAELRHKLEKQKQRKLSKEEKKLFLARGSKFIEKIFQDRENHKQSSNKTQKDKDHKASEVTCTVPISPPSTGIKCAKPGSTSKLGINNSGAIKTPKQAKGNASHPVNKTSKDAVQKSPNGTPKSQKPLGKSPQGAQKSQKPLGISTQSTPKSLNPLGKSTQGTPKLKNPLGKSPQGTPKSQNPLGKSPQSTQKSQHPLVFSSGRGKTSLKRQRSGSWEPLTPSPPCKSKSLNNSTKISTPKQATKKGDIHSDSWLPPTPPVSALSPADLSGLPLPIIKKKNIKRRKLPSTIVDQVGRSTSKTDMFIESPVSKSPCLKSPYSASSQGPLGKVHTLSSLSSPTNTNNEQYTRHGNQLYLNSTSKSPMNNSVSTSSFGKSGGVETTKRISPGHRLNSTSTCALADGSYNSVEKPNVNNNTKAQSGFSQSSLLQSPSQSILGGSKSKSQNSRPSPLHSSEWKIPSERKIHNERKIPSASSPMVDLTEDDSFNPVIGDVLVPCPLCQVKFSSSIIEVHAATCDGVLISDDDDIDLLTQSITTQSSSMKDDDVTQGVSMQEMSTLQDVSKQGILESVESACVTKPHPTSETCVPKSSVLSLTSSPGVLKSSCGVPKSVSSGPISDVPKTSFEIQRTTHSVMQPCPLCQVTYPSDVIEIHASTCQGGFLEDDDFDPVDFMSEPPIDQNKNPKSNDTNLQNAKSSVLTSHSDVLKSKSDVLTSESGVPNLTNGAPSLKAPQPSSPVESSSSKSSSSPRQCLYITQKQSSSTDCSSRALTKSADMTKSARTEIQKTVPKSASSGFFETTKDSICNLLGVKRITSNQTTEDVSKTQSQTQQNQIQNGQNDSPNNTHDMTPNRTPHMTPTKGHPGVTNTRPPFSPTGCSPVRSHTNSSALVECPVCGSSFKESLIFEHAEHCEEEFSLQDGEESGNY